MPVLLGGFAFLRAGALADAGRLARARAQVIELGAAHVALALHLDRGDEPRIGLESALHAFAGGNLAHDEGGIEPAAFLGDHHAFESLHALALAFDHIDAHHHRVARGKIRDVPGEPLDFFLLECLDQIHDFAPLSCRNSSSSLLSSSLSLRTASRSGLLSQVRPSACFSRQRRMFSWCPDNSTSGTFSPRYVSGRVYCGQSSSPSANDSSITDAGSPTDPGSCRTTASISAIAARPPPESTKSPIEISSSTRRLSSLSSTPS